MSLGTTHFMPNMFLDQALPSHPLLMLVLLYLEHSRLSDA